MLLVPSHDAVYFRVAALEWELRIFFTTVSSNTFIFYNSEAPSTMTATLLIMHLSYPPPWWCLLSFEGHSKKLFAMLHNEHKAISRCFLLTAFQTSVVFNNWTEFFKCNMFLINCLPLPTTAEHLCSAWNVPKVSFDLSNVDGYEHCSQSW